MTLFRGGKCNFIIKKNLLKFVLINVLFFFFFLNLEGAIGPPAKSTCSSVHLYGNKVKIDFTNNRILFHLLEKRIMEPRKFLNTNAFCYLHTNLQ